MSGSAESKLEPERLLSALRRVCGRRDLELCRAPVRLAFGSEALIDALELRHAPPELAGPLVVRRLVRPGREDQIEREAAVHRALDAQGYPVPRVVASDASGGLLGAPFLVMRQLDGEMPLHPIVEPGALLRRPARIPSLVVEALWRVPVLLAQTHVRLHALDVERFRGALRDAGVDADAMEFGERLASLEQQAFEAELVGLLPGIEWLRSKRPSEGPQVVCHGDLVFTNLHVRSVRLAGVLDWSQATLAAREYDVAGAVGRLESAVPGVPWPLAATFRLVQRGMTARFLRAYRRVHPIDGRARLLRGLLAASRARGIRRPPAGRRGLQWPHHGPLAGRGGGSVRRSRVPAENRRPSRAAPPVAPGAQRSAPPQRAAGLLAKTRNSSGKVLALAIPSRRDCGGR